jgi:hypothetical protein
VKVIHTSTSSAAPETPTPTTLLNRLNQLPDDAKWALDHIITMDDGATIATALQNNTALAVSDGSLKLGFGTAAYVLEGIDSNNRILGVNEVPGPIKDGDSHRCEVAGIYAVALLVMAICKHHNIHKGTITMAFTTPKHSNYSTQNIYRTQAIKTSISSTRHGTYYNKLTLPGLETT